MKYPCKHGVTRYCMLCDTDMTTIPQNNEGQIATPMTDELLKIQDEQENYPREPWIVLALRLEQKLHQANSQIESLKQEVIEWRDDRQKVNADLSEELAKMKADLEQAKKITAELFDIVESVHPKYEVVKRLKAGIEYVHISQSNKKSELVAELVDAADPFIRLLSINDSLPPAFRKDEWPLYDKIPRVWPTYGDLRILVKALSRAANL